MLNYELESKLALLVNPLWNNRDIMNYTGYIVNKAIVKIQNLK